MWRNLIISSLLLPVTAFATITATDRGTGNNNVAGTSVICSPTSTIAAGSTGIFVISMDNASGASTNITGTSITDSVGNIWYLRKDAVSGTANASNELAVYTSLLTVAVTSSDTLTVALNASTTAKAWTFVEAAPSAGNIVLYADSLIQTSTTTTGTPSITSTAEIQNAGLIVGFGGSQSADTWVSDGGTTNGTWTAKQSNAAGTGAAGMSVISQNKVVTAYAAQTFAPTLTSVLTRLGWISFIETDVKARTVGGSAVSAASDTITFNRGMASGSLGVIAFSAANAGSGGSTANIPTSFNDSKSNTWTLQQTLIFDPGAASAGAEIGIYTSVLTTPIVVGDTATVTYTAVNVAEKSWAIWEFAPIGAGSMTYVTGGVGTGAATATPTVTSGTIANGDYIIGVAGSEGLASWTGDADTSNGTWLTQAAYGRGASAGSSQSVTTQWKKVTAAATQTYNPTQGSALDTAIAWIEINDSSVVGPTAAQKAAFFMLFP